MPLIVNDKCEDCIHSKICRIKDDRLEAIQQTDEFIRKLELNVGVFINQCPEFSSRPKVRTTPFGTFKQGEQSSLLPCMGESR